MLDMYNKMTHFQELTYLFPCELQFSFVLIGVYGKVHEYRIAISNSAFLSDGL